MSTLTVQARIQGQHSEFTTHLWITDCTCGLIFAMPQELEKRRRADGQTFYCPNGHPLTFKESTKDKELRIAREQLDAERARAEMLRQEVQRVKRKAAADKKKTATRSSNGVCPHPDCHRSFVDVARHVRSKHPELLPATA